jgi:ADP-ribose pyrophosphatase
MFHGRIVDVDVDSITMPNGSQLELEVVRHPGGAAVVALDERERVCVLRQYRPVISHWVWEIPAGKIDAGEPPLETACRELAEEVGVAATRWDELGAILSSPGIFTERIHLFLARGLSAVKDSPHDNEVFEVHWIPFEEALRRACSSGIEDAKSVAALTRAAYFLRREAQ